jgi:DNA repair protein SbcC/Rad50
MINELKLHNWKSHINSEFKFTAGTNVLIGNMGSGKSSVLQAISFALFGTFTELKHRTIKSSDIISRTAEQKIAEINLSLTTPTNKNLIIKRKITKDKTTEGTIRDFEGKLVAGPLTTQLNEYIQKQIGTNEDIFMRTVYSVQNDADMLLKLSPKERKKRVDELMGLDKFDKARENSIKLRNKTLRKKQDTEAFLESLGLEQLSNKMSDIYNQIESLKSKQLSMKSELSRKKTEKETYRINMLELRDKFQESEKKLERKRSILQQISELEEQLKDKKARNKNEIEKDLEETKNKIINYQKQKSAFSEKINRLQLDFMSADKKLALSTNKINNIKSKLFKISQIKDELNQNKIFDLNTELAELKKELDKQKDVKQANLAQLRELRKHLEQLTLAGDECPVCSNQMNEQTKLKIIYERKQEISKVLMTNTDISEIVLKLENRYSQLQDISQRNRHILEDLSNETELKQELNQIETEININKKIYETSETEIKLSKEHILLIENNMSNLTLSISVLNNEIHIEERKQQHLRKISELELIDNDLKIKKVTKQEVNSCEEKFQMLLRYVQELTTTLSNFESILTEKANQLAELKNQQIRALEMQTNINKFEEEAQFLERFRTAVEATQLSLRDELILAVNEVMAQVWIDIYPYEKWSAVRLASTESDYMLQIKEAEGNWLPVSGFASGGERMLASLAVRIAFARVLAPNLSLLILDEPTHNLDEKAITTFIDVIQNKVSDFIDQIFIVTHEEKLSENADNIIHLE